MFEPDGVGTVVLLWAIAVLVVVTFAWFGHHVGDRGWKHALARLGSVTATSLAGVLAVTAMLNSQYGWYSSWSDLASSFTGQYSKPVDTAYGAQKRTPVESKAEAEAIDKRANIRYAGQRAAYEKRLTLEKNPPNGQWIKVVVPGIPLKGKDIGRVMVWLPPSYATSPNRTYPVIEAFHGIPGGTLDYERVFHLGQHLTDAVRNHTMREAIVVVPQAMPAGIDTECVNGGGLQMEDWLTKTVPDYVVSHLRAQAAAESWLTMGVSAGGWCASMAGLLHPDRYAGIASLGGYYQPDFVSNWNPYAKSTLPKKYDLVDRVAGNPTNQALWVLISGADKISTKSTEAFVKAVRAPNVLTTVDYPNAGHRVDVWERALPDVFTWMGKTFDAFAWSADASSTIPSAPSPTSSRTRAPGAPRSRLSPGATATRRPGVHTPTSPAVPRVHATHQPVVPQQTAPGAVR